MVITRAAAISLHRRRTAPSSAVFRPRRRPKLSPHVTSRPLRSASPLHFPADASVSFHPPSRGLDFAMQPRRRHSGSGSTTSPSLSLPASPPHSFPTPPYSFSLFPATVTECVSVRACVYRDVTSEVTLPVTCHAATLPHAVPISERRHLQGFLRPRAR